MGEIADMMIGGDLCEACGMALDGEGYGISRYCSNACAKDRGYDGINPDGSGRYGKVNPHKGKHPQDLISIKITYNGDKIYYATKSNSSFKEASEIAKILNTHIGQTDTFGIQPRFVHPKAKLSSAPTERKRQ